MKGADLIKLIQEEGLEDFDIHFFIGGCGDNSGYGATWVTLKDLCVDDISRSVKIAQLGFNDTLDFDLKVEYK